MRFGGKMINRGIAPFWMMKVSQRSEIIPPEGQKKVTFGPDSSPGVYEVEIADAKTDAGIHALTLGITQKLTMMTLTNMLFTVTAMLDSISYLDKKTTRYPMMKFITTITMVIAPEYVLYRAFSVSSPCC